ncbi:capsule biosynthesis protein [Maritimibacter sp. DP1N21-5]|uniref:capsule biosynthesis protein n=1 Tax=Maritimibacter sp. DP1N21-5 TaxID=2836867 RepID=UPI001C475439|nr:capsule biosynthesis protein CapA [Maritimibacter sp. DP1N21-5]MBV7410211.1 capsule biosynthesis protein CapA [Maritimibacter sp. DP1N21-5]
MMAIDGTDRVFLFLQGPHGPYYRSLARMLRASGAAVWRVGFNKGDEVFWGHRASFLPFAGPQSDWPARIREILADKAVTDLVLYGDTRFIHAEAVRAAEAAGITVHVFEEGYLRPYWVSYERGGANGHSRLMEMDVDAMQRVLANAELDIPEPPAHWGDMRHHIFYGALYHWFVMFANRRYAGFRPHRDLSVTKEFALYIKRLLLMPYQALERMLATMRVKNAGYPYHLALLQLAHDSSFVQHSPFTSITEFLDLVIGGFAEGAPRHHHLVFKAHPLEDGRENQRRQIRRIARDKGVADRVHYIRGGKLARLLDHARSAVTVNSTAAQQVLWRGLPLKVFGRAVYAKPEFVSTQTLPEFFAQPARPDSRAYRDYRHYLLETSQIPGGFYSARGRRQLLRQIVDMMLAADDPYDALEKGTAAPRQQLRVIK